MSGKVGISCGTYDSEGRYTERVGGEIGRNDGC